MVIEEYKVPGTDDLLLCDTSINHTRPLILQKYRLKVFNSFHKLAHSGTETTVKMMQTRVIWPGMRKQISSWSKSCPECQKGKVWKHNWTPMQKFDLPLQRFQHVCIDLVKKLPMSEGYQYLVSTDHRGSFYEICTSYSTEGCDSGLRVFRFSSRLGSVYGCSSVLTVRPW